MKNPWFHPDRIGTYKGEMQNGLAHGRGTYTSSFKGKKGKYKYFYKGSFLNGLKHGKAIQIFNLPAHVIKFKGSFKNDLTDGHGILITFYKGKLEKKYIGQFKKGYRHGKGKEIDYFQKTTKQGKFVKGGFKK